MHREELRLHGLPLLVLGDSHVPCISRLREPSDVENLAIAKQAARNRRHGGHEGIVLLGRNGLRHLVDVQKNEHGRVHHKSQFLYHHHVPGSGQVPVDTVLAVAGAVLAHAEELRRVVARAGGGIFLIGDISVRVGPYQRKLRIHDLRINQEVALPGHYLDAHPEESEGRIGHGFADGENDAAAVHRLHHELGPAGGSCGN